jgi:hypothetical protein
MVTKQAIKEKLVPNWQVTATTIHCDIVGREVTIMVYKDWHTACAYYGKWGAIRREKRKGIERALGWLGIISEEKHIPAPECKGPQDCPKVIEYRDKLYKEEEELAAKKEQS